MHTYVHSSHLSRIYSNRNNNNGTHKWNVHVHWRWLITVYIILEFAAGFIKYVHVFYFCIVLTLFHCLFSFIIRETMLIWMDAFKFCLAAYVSRALKVHLVIDRSYWIRLNWWWFLLTSNLNTNLMIQYNDRIFLERRSNFEQTKRILLLLTFLVY